MEASALRHLGATGAHGRSPLLRLQSDERLISLVRRGNEHAFEVLVSRYQARLLSFCRHMLRSREDAEDVLQEVFAASYNAILADDRPINVRPWLYRIARNRSLNHMRRIQPIAVDTMDQHFSEGGLSTAEKVHKREDFRELVGDVQQLPESQRTALLMREIDALSYEQIAEAMETTVPSVKSLLVRARVGLAEAKEARTLTCDDVRLELGEVAEGLKRVSPPVRRHLRSCDQCANFRKQLATSNRALAAFMPVGPLLLLKKSLLAQFGAVLATSGSAAGGGSGAAATGVLQLGASAVATKTAAGLAAAAIVTAGAVEAKHVTVQRQAHPIARVAAVAPVAAPVPSVAGGQVSQPLVAEAAKAPADADNAFLTSRPADEKPLKRQRDKKEPVVKAPVVKAAADLMRAPEVAEPDTENPAPATTPPPPTVPVIEAVPEETPEPVAVGLVGEQVKSETAELPVQTGAPTQPSPSDLAATAPPTANPDAPAALAGPAPSPAPARPAAPVAQAALPEPAAPASPPAPAEPAAPSPSSAPARRTQAAFPETVTGQDSPPAAEAASPSEPAAP
ncbi:MAG: sigma-70 family RNA polymerase sigma factor [Actinomycetota bacterium]|nr:sigma-70 family RNA polymerase sigma factor [Actinomycetota bacterium]